jgi:murein DD-endopeptidase MepM/ murein hydrolase activator NlpD
MDEVKLFFKELYLFVFKKLNFSFWKFEKGKGVFVGALYRQRGKLSRRLMHTGMALLAGMAMFLAPFLAKEFPGRSVNPWDVTAPTSVLSATEADPQMQTLVSDKIRDKVMEYQVQAGDTVSSLADKFGVSTNTIRWQNNLTGDKLKVGQTLHILPVTGILHKVQKGDTVYSIAKKYDASPQGIVDFPFNTFINDETFDLAIGQTVIVPDGVMPKAQPAPRIRQLTPDAGTVVASGIFVWPTSGTITQRYSWYHPGIDIANSALPEVLAADSGKVAVAGWSPVGYGNHVVIDHGNGYRTLYAHLQVIYVSVGQSVARGNRIGRMGSTGRSTGPHCHFEIILNGVHLNPLSVLK